MRKLIVLGNGFDLACDLKTGFYDFYRTKKSNIVTPHGCNPKTNFILFLIYETFFSSDNVKMQFQRLLNIDSFDDWMDIELLLNHFILGNVFKIAQRVFEYEDYDEEEIVVKKEFKNYFDRRFVGLLRNENFDFFVEKELFLFENELKDYLKLEVNKNEMIYLKKEKLLNLISKDDPNCILMTFNYTKPVQNFNNPISYVHGSLDNGIIVGIEFLDTRLEDSYKKINGIVSDKTVFTKTKKRLMHIAIDERNVNILDKLVNHITFYGHSLGEQDYSYFQSLFDFYNIYSSDVILEFCYTEYKQDTSPAYELDRQIERVFRLINKYGGTLNNKDHGKNLLNKMLLENRIVFRQIKQESYK